jgi:hypothetical protein
LTARWRGERISNAVFTEIETLTDFDPVFLDLVRGESGERDAARSAKSRDFMQKLADVERQLENVSRFIRRGDESDWLRNDLLRLEGDRRTTARSSAAAQEPGQDGQGETARLLGITVTAAQKAAALHRLMQESGMTDPYVRVFEPRAKSRCY